MMQQMAYMAHVDAWTRQNQLMLQQTAMQASQAAQASGGNVDPQVQQWLQTQYAMLQMQQMQIQQQMMALHQQQQQQQQRQP